ncbi:dTDP-3-amino-3,4,6-trideoxy-alpha-D-glucose transaminase [bacterium HR29]|nr:dTDP-3-amino-3,4,6-trideoxy-alpha-D-glucose transaminase [bacterium HR29]
MRRWTGDAFGITFVGVGLVTASQDRRIPIAQPLIGREEQEAVLEVLASGQLAQGPRVAAFERAFAQYVGTRHAVAVANGTAALVVALQAHGVGPGDEVVTTPFSFVATATSILACGARPVFADVDPDDLNLNPDAVERALSPRTRAVVAVHLYGHPARIDELAELCDRRGLALIEDAAQAHGAAHHGRRVGSFGTGCFSFYPTKNMTTGEGGMITTDDDEVAARARQIRDHGQSSRYRHDIFGLNWRMAEVAAAIGLAQLAKLEAWNERRIRNAAVLSAELRGVRTPRVREGDRHVFHQYTIRVPEGRERLRVALESSGIGTAVHYPLPIHRQPLFVRLGYGEESFPVAERAAEEVLSLPVHPALTDVDLERIVDAVNRATR